MLGNGKHSTVDYLDCYHSVRHISQLESLKYRAGSAAAILFRIGPHVDSSPSLHSWQAAIQNILVLLDKIDDRVFHGARIMRDTEVCGA